MSAPTSVTIVQTIPAGHHVTFELIDAATYQRDSGGGWQVIDRPRRQASTEWVDYGPLTMTLPLMIDGTAGLGTVVEQATIGAGRRSPGFGSEQAVSAIVAAPWASVEATITYVEGWEKPAGVEPPKLQVVSGPVAHRDLTWVIKSLTWPGDVIRDPQSGERVQQKVTVTLLEYVPPTVAILSASPAAAAQQRQATTTVATAAGKAPVKPSGRTYTVKAGDTLSAIAVRFFGNYRRETDIAALNGIRDMNRITVGQVLKLPAS